MKNLLLVCAALVLALPPATHGLGFASGATAAQAAQQPAAHQHDPDKMVAGGGKFPAGWQARLDKADAKIDTVKFVTMEPGFHVTTGPATILFNPAKTVKGEYQAKATFHQMKLSAHPEAYGLFVGGADLSGPNQRYTYFIIRQDGKYMLKRRTGADTKTLVDWTESPAVKKPDAQGRMTNSLAVVAGKETVRFLVNGTEVAAQPRSQVDADGIAGLRVNHNLDVHVEGFDVQAGTTH